MKKDVNEVKLKKSQAGEEEFLWAADTLEEAKDGGMRAQRMEDEGVVLHQLEPFSEGGNQSSHQDSARGRPAGAQPQSE